MDVVRKDLVRDAEMSIGTGHAALAARCKRGTIVVGRTNAGAVCVTMTPGILAPAAMGIEIPVIRAAYEQLIINNRIQSMPESRQKGRIAAHAATGRRKRSVTSQVFMYPGNESGNALVQLIHVGCFITGARVPAPVNAAAERRVEIRRGKAFFPAHHDAANRRLPFQFRHVLRITVIRAAGARVQQHRLVAVRRERQVAGHIINHVGERQLGLVRVASLRQQLHAVILVCGNQAFTPVGASLFAAVVHVVIAVLIGS